MQHLKVPAGDTHENKGWLLTLQSTVHHDCSSKKRLSPAEVKDTPTENIANEPTLFFDPFPLPRLPSNLCNKGEWGSTDRENCAAGRMQQEQELSKFRARGS